MKPILSISVLVFLLVAASHQCLAMIDVMDVSREKAKELGVTIRTNNNGQAGVQVRMEFKTAGELAKITYVQVQLGEREGRIMSAPLQVTNPDPGTASVNFSAFPAYLAESSLMIVVYNGPKGDVGYRFKVKDFIEPEKAR